MSTWTNPSLPFHGLGSPEAIRQLGDQLPDGLFTTDLTGRITYWNLAAQRITGWSPEEALGKSCSLLAGDAVNGCSCGVGPIRCGMVERGRTSKCCTVLTRDGRLLLIVKNAVPLYTSAGQPVGALESFTDVGSVAGFERRIAELRSPAGAAADFCGLTGRSLPMQELYKIIGLVARSESTVMVLGESGTGKELVAEAIHRLGPRAAGPFVRVSCSALNENLLESELFGHVKGAFTGALRDRRGRFEEAHGGTLLLDEIGDVSPLVQVKLLRVIEQREVERVGDSQPRRVDVRLLCATHRDLKRLVAEGRFRADLFFRLNVFPLRVPPLRERVEDLPALCERFLAGLRRPVARHMSRLTPEAVRAMTAYPWPGNVRELQNVLEYASLQAGEADIEPGHLPAEIRATAGPAAAGGAPRPSSDEERLGLRSVLERCGWNRSRAARELGVSRVTLWKRMKKLGVGEPADA